MSEKNYDKQQFLLGLFGGIALVSIIGVVVLSLALINANKTGQVAGATEKNTNTPTGDTTQTPTIQGVAATAAGVKTFLEKSGADVCKENGKPVVYLFSTTWCSHCGWIKETFDTAIKQYVAQGKIAAYHWELDTGDNTLTDQVETTVPDEAMAVYQEFNPDGSIPTFVFGCKYYRIGNGYEAQNDLAAEQKEYAAVINDLTK